MKAVIFMGIQASGKSTFFREQFAGRYVHINLDTLKTRYREKVLLTSCIEAQKPFVIDNTNPTPDDRARYILPAKTAGYEITGYYFQSIIQDCALRNEKRNQERAKKQQIPFPALAGTAKKLVLPAYAEGFDTLYYVRIDPKGGFFVEKYTEEPSEENAHEI